MIIKQPGAEFFYEDVCYKIGDRIVGTDAKYILKRLKSTGEMEITKRDLFNLCDGKMGTIEELQPGLDILIDRGYIAVEKIKTGSRGRPTEKIYLNPEMQKVQKVQKYPEHKNI